MNEKIPNTRTQAAMTEARAMARSRMPELVESTAGVESLPNFSLPARQRWESIPTDVNHCHRLEICFPSTVDAQKANAWL